MSLPPFLDPFPSTTPHTAPYLQGLFPHKQLQASTHSLWWPPKHGPSETILFFIPGNPGLLHFYTPFLNAIYEKDTTSKLAIFGHSHIGHTPGIENPKNTLTSFTSRYGLVTQTESALESFDAIRHTYGDSMKIVVIGHSVGSWFALQILRERPNSVSAAFLLFPTISNMANTPNGKRLSWCFSPRVSPVISSASYLIKLIPELVFSWLFLSWPIAQIQVLRGFLQSPTSIQATLSMANDEMKHICSLDSNLLALHRDRLWYYFGEQDDWVGDEKAKILASIASDSDVVRALRGSPDIPHAFCINHGETLAEHCHQWLTIHMASVAV